MAEDSSDRDLFYKSGPMYLTNNVDWDNPDDKKTVIASLVKRVYVSEHDRQKHREGFEALAPLWSELFGFILDKHLIDEHDGSIIGAIFKYNLHDNNTNEYNLTPPHGCRPVYVIAFRGTVLEYATVIRDIYSDMKLILNRVARQQTALQAARELINKVGPHNILLAGHSLGAAIALHIGKTLAGEGCHIETYLFNPPYPSAPIEMLNNRVLKTVIHLSVDLAIVLADAAASKIIRTGTPGNIDQFIRLSPWVPKLFVNRKDPISCEYIGYFEHRAGVEPCYSDCIWRTTAQESFGSIVARLSGREGEAFYLIPSAQLVKNSQPMQMNLKLTHGICQWWAPHTNWDTKYYLYDLTSASTSEDKQMTETQH